MPKTEKNVYVDSFLGTSKNWEFCFQEIVWFWVIFLKSCANSCFYIRRLRLASWPDGEEHTYIGHGLQQSFNGW